MIDEVLKTITDNPITASAFGAVVAALLAFVKPIARAFQRALIRRIDQAWPDDDNEMDYEAKVKHTLANVSLAPKSVVEAAIRKHKSNPPAKG